MIRSRVLSVLGGAAAVTGAIALAPSAQAACAWGGYGWVCDQPVPPQVSAAPVGPAYAPQVGTTVLPSVPRHQLGQPALHAIRVQLQQL